MYKPMTKKKKRKKKQKKKKKKKKKKTEGIKQKACHRIRTRHHRLHSTNVFIQRFSSYFKAVGPNRFLCKILLSSKCIAKSTFFNRFLKRGHNFSWTKIGASCASLRTYRLTDLVPKGRQQPQKQTIMLFIFVGPETKYSIPTSSSSSKPLK